MIRVCPRRESFRDLQKRTVPAFDEILRENPCGNIVLFAHGGVIWTLMCNYFGFKLNDIFSIRWIIAAYI